ncbi:hypothetical protein IFM53868_05852 [Aspergillus udagawae]|uniref:Uncharacterized protein n=1 Tax=Aspergillus udagawae TaxID=91492 RepID=A0ABQ1AWR9_9EURO|nr:hypothetical protein IFM53868_05852 [Aspergillus udagawae]
MRFFVPVVLLSASVAYALDLLRVCADFGLQRCAFLPVVAECISLTGQLSSLDNQISSMLVPEGYTCQLFRDTGCPRVSKYWTVKLAAGTWSQFNLLHNQAGERVNLDNAHAISRILHRKNDRATVCPPEAYLKLFTRGRGWSAAYSQPFDYIHGRELEGAIRDHDNLFQQALENRRLGGWLEMASMDVNSYSDDGTRLKAVNLVEGIKTTHFG